MGCEEFRDQMLDVLYGEAGASAREFDTHQQGCTSCRDELRALRGLRRDLAAWKIPARAGSPFAAAGRVPRWTAMAAALLAAAAAALVIAGADARVGDGGISVRIGRPEPDAVAAALAAQEARHRTAIDSLAARIDATPRAGASLEDVRRLILESEARQAVLVDAGLRGFAERSESQRRDDLAQVSAGLTYLEGRTGLQVARTTELMGHVLQASQKK